MWFLRLDIGRSGSVAPIFDRSSRTFACSYQWSRAEQFHDDRQDISELLSKNFPRAALRQSIYLFFMCGMQRLPSPRYSNSGATPMQAFGATAVAALILYVADQFLNAGRYSEVVVDALKQVGLLVGINV
jgi:hypothetical protein